MSHEETVNIEINGTPATDCYQVMPVSVVPLAWSAHVGDGFIVHFHVQEQVAVDDLEGQFTGAPLGCEDGSTLGFATKAGPCSECAMSEFSGTACVAGRQLRTSELDERCCRRRLGRHSLQGQG